MNNIKLTNEQMKLIEQMKQMRHCILTADTGTGKTIISINASVGNTLAIVPNKELKKQWEEYNIPNMQICTYTECSKFDYLSKKFETVIIDEAHKVNQSSNRTKTCVKCVLDIKPAYLYLMTATPLIKHESDLLNMVLRYKMKVPLKGLKMTKKALQQEFFLADESFNFIFNRYQTDFFDLKHERADEFKSLINLLSLKHDKFSVFKEKIDFKGFLCEEYKLLKKEKYSNVLDKSANGLIRANYLHQLSNNLLKIPEHLITNSNYYGNADNLILKIDFIKKNVLTKHKRIIIVYNFNAELECLKKNFEKYTENKDEFNINSNLRIFFRQFNKAEGINMPDVNTIVWVTYGFSSVAFEQMHGRVTRQNSLNNNVYYYYLVCSNNIESKIFDVITKRITKNKMIKELK